MALRPAPSPSRPPLYYPSPRHCGGIGLVHPAFGTPDGRLWVIIEVDRSATTVLLPSEY